MTTKSVILGVLATLLLTGTAMADGVVYVGVHTKDGPRECVSVLDGGEPVKPGSSDCPSPPPQSPPGATVGRQNVRVSTDQYMEGTGPVFDLIHALVDVIVGAEYGPVRECWIIGAGVPHRCDFGSLEELLARVAQTQELIDATLP